MSARYVAAKPRPQAIVAGDDWYPEPRETVEVIVEDAAPRRIGLVDQYGVPIWRLPIRERCGF